MAEMELRQCEYFLIRIAPDPVRNEYLNIGVALYEPQSQFVAVRLISDFQRIRCLFPSFDPADLAGLEEDLIRRLSAPGAVRWLSREYLLELAQESFAHALQLTPPNAVLTRDPATEVEELFRRYAAPPQALSREAVRLGPRRRVLRRLQQIFEQERLKDHLRHNLRVSDLVPDPDPFRFDYYYKPNGVHHFIQALALGGSDADIRELGFTTGRLQRLLPSGLEVTAVIDVAEPGTRSEVLAARSFHEELLREAGIQLVPLDQAHELAARIRQHLHLG
jgi:hypothetical protein